MATVLEPTVKVPAELKQQLEELAKDTGRSEAELVEAALAGYIAHEKPIITRLKEGVAAAKRGELVDHEEVDVWLQSWEAGNPLPRPKAKA